MKNRLFRKSKDELVARVIELEQSYAIQEEQWLKLNDELLEWILRAEKTEEHVEKLKRTLETKEIQIQELRKRI